MNELLIGKEYAFLKRGRTYPLPHIRQEFYYAAYELYGSPTHIQRILKEEFNFSVNQQTIYHGWYKIKKKMEEMTPRMFIKKHYGSEAIVNGRGIEKLMDAYAAYQLSLHIDHPTQPDRQRLDIKRKIKELKARCE